MYGCDPASAERGTIEINVDKETLSNQVLKPPGVEVPPNLAKKASRVQAGSTAEIPPK
jgi:hypothetical protein